MDRRLLALYEQELHHLRETAAEFAREYPKVAGRLSLDEFECADPYVERLLEGFAFLAARVQLKLNAQFPRFTQGLLETVYPHYLAPTPSMAVVRFDPDPQEASLASGHRIPRGTVLRGLRGAGDLTACEYRTSHDLTLWPLRIAEARHHTRDLGTLGLPSVPGVRAAIRIRLETTGNLPVRALAADSLVFFLRGQGDVPARLLEQVMARAVRVIVRPAGRPAKWHEFLPDGAVSRVGYGDEEAILPHGPRSFQGYRLLREYAAFPQRFMFFRVGGLQPAFKRCAETQCELIVMLDSPAHDLEGLVDAGCVSLNCTPAANLFPKRCDRIPISERDWEFQVVPDRTRPLDFEVYQVRSVTGYGGVGHDGQEFRPFYAATGAYDDAAAAYYAVHRVPRTLSAREQRGVRRSTYAGSEVYLTLVDAHAAPYRSDLVQVGVEALCTNRDLPLHMVRTGERADFTLDVEAPVEGVRCVAGPTEPIPAHPEGELAWRIISHLSLNYLSLVDSDEREGAAALRDLFRLYADAAGPEVRKQVAGLRSVRSAPVVRRLPVQGPIAFGRGLEVTVTLDETAFEGIGVFVLGSVLEEFFARYVAINSFTETVLRTPERGEVTRWPARLGRRHTL